ncbi:MAG: GNAT family N-acetyltransferase [Ruminococcus flavefaciens]|nr:GNAT family N-acetyltransferase [Ruminococcus flavefaciens]
MKVENLTKEELISIGSAIGDSFYEHKYGKSADGVQEKGLAELVGSRENMRKYMTACLIAGYESGGLYTTGENREGYIVVLTPDNKMGIGTSLRMVCRIIGSVGLGGALRMVKQMKKGGISYEDELKKKKVKYAFLGMLVVMNEYKGQGYMRKLMEMLYEIADEQHLPIVFDTDAKNKADKYIYLGMTLAKTRDMGNGIILYDLYRGAK